MSPLAFSLPQDTSCSPIMVQKLDVAPQAACIDEITSCHCPKELQPSKTNPWCRAVVLKDLPAPSLAWHKVG